MPDVVDLPKLSDLELRTIAQERLPTQTGRAKAARRELLRRSHEANDQLIRDSIGELTRVVSSMTLYLNCHSWDEWEEAIGMLLTASRVAAVSWWYHADNGDGISVRWMPRGNNVTVWPPRSGSPRWAEPIPPHLHGLAERLADLCGWEGR